MVTNEHVGDVLTQAAQTVLETMFFMMAEGEAVPGFGPEADLLHTSMRFNGWWSGAFEMRVPTDCAKTIAESFVGADDEMTPDRISEVMCELTNMVCGSTLSQLAHDRIFNLTAPRIEADPAAQLSTAATITASRALNLGDGIVSFAMSIEGAS